MSEIKTDEQFEIIPHDQFCLGLVNNWIQIADSKASFLLTITLALIGALFSIVPYATKFVEACVRKNAGYFWLGFVESILFIFTAGCFVFALLKLVSVVKPRLTSVTDHKSVLFYQSIATMGFETYKSKLKTLDMKKLNNEYEDQIFNNSKVAKDKYKEIKDAICLMIWGGFFEIVFVLDKKNVDLADLPTDPHVKYITDHTHTIAYNNASALRNLGIVHAQ